MKSQDVKSKKRLLPKKENVSSDGKRRHRMKPVPRVKYKGRIFDEEE